MKHTKGPWRVNKGDADIDEIYVQAEVGPYVCSFKPDVKLVGYRKPEKLANAHLIAAAPDMYEALKKIIETLYSHSDKTLPWRDAQLSVLYKIIAKAEGK